MTQERRRHRARRVGTVRVDNPVGRSNDAPSSRDVGGGPCEIPDDGFRSAEVRVDGDKRPVRASSFADQFSRARRFYRNQTMVDQMHIAEALTFELSKVEEAAIRKRIVAMLVNVDSSLAEYVATDCGRSGTPKAMRPLVRPRDSLLTSDALSIQKSGPDLFAGRVLGVLVADGCDAGSLKALRHVARKSKVEVKLVAITVNGISDSDGNELQIAKKVDGGPSVLFDAIAILTSKSGLPALLDDPTSHDYVSDAWNLKKYIACHGPVDELFKAAGVGDWQEDDGVISLAADRRSAEDFLALCKNLRHWKR